MGRKAQRAFAGMNAAQAIAVIECCWERHQEALAKPMPDESTPQGKARARFARDFRYSYEQMHSDIRDVGWCLGHAGGMTLMLEAAEAINDKKLSNGHLYDGFINHCWHGIGGWTA
jgi:hypothetical protein